MISLTVSIKDFTNYIFQDTLKVENFAGTKFRGSKKPRNFCVSRVLNFAVAHPQVSFAGIKFMVSFKNKKAGRVW